MRVILSLVAVSFAIVGMTHLGLFGHDGPCLTKAQGDAKIAQIDTYSWYDPMKPDTIERLSPEKVRQVTAIEDRECGS